MTGIATIGLARNDQHHYYVDGKGPLPGVTGILQIVAKPAIVPWAKRITAEAAVDHRVELETWVELGGRDGAIQLLTRAADTLRDRAATKGSDVHALASAIAQGHSPEMTEEQAGYVNSYLAFRHDFQPKTLATEELICNLRHGYGGTLDEIDEIFGENWLLDLKTSRGVYAETSMQLAGYKNAEFIGRPGDPKRYALPRIDQCGVLHLTPTGYELIPFDVTEDTFQAFLAAKALSAWMSTTAKTVMGQAIGPQLLKFQAPAKEAIA